MKYIATAVLMFFVFKLNAQCTPNQYESEEEITLYSDYVFVKRGDEQLSFSFMKIKGKDEYSITINYTPANKVELKIRSSNQLVIKSINKVIRLTPTQAPLDFNDGSKFIVIAKYSINKEQIKILARGMSIISIQTSKGDKTINVSSNMEKKLIDGAKCILSVE